MEKVIVPWAFEHNAPEPVRISSSWYKVKIEQNEEVKIEVKPKQKLPKLGVKVRCIETGLEYKSIADAKKASGVSTWSIHKSLITGESSSGFHWEKVDGKDKRKENPVLCIETGQVFPSIKEASIFCGVGHSSIGKAIRNKTRVCGYYWAYADDDNEELIAMINKKKTKQKAKPKQEGRPVILLGTGQTFKSITEASKAGFGGHTSIWNVCSGNIRSSNGRVWRFLSEDGKIIEPKKNYCLKRNIKCIDTGEIFYSMHEASEAKKISKYQIYRCLEKKAMKAGKLHWEWVEEEEQ